MSTRLITKERADLAQVELDNETISFFMFFNEKKMHFIDFFCMLPMFLYICLVNQTLNRFFWFLLTKQQLLNKIRYL